jgi:hypothetical protein
MTNSNISGLSLGGAGLRFARKSLDNYKGKSDERSPETNLDVPYLEVSKAPSQVRSVKL